MKNLILLISIIISIIAHNERKSFKELVDTYLNDLDINNAYLSYDQYLLLLNTLKEDFPNYLELSSIGKTHEGNEMYLIKMKSAFKSNKDIPKITNSTEKNNKDNETNNLNYNYKDDDQSYIMEDSLYNKSGIFFNGMHHAREPVSLMMNIYLILHLLSLPKTYLHIFLSSINIYFLPLINADTYKYNCEKYFLTNSTKSMYSRKNRERNFLTNCKNGEDIGVDLNRNYDYFFGEDDKGSSGSPCSEQYRGEFPFSEPETINIKNFIEDRPDIKIAINYHSWGNLIITPFNYLKSNKSEEILQNEFPMHYKMYQDFKKEANYPINFLFGNGDNTIQYLANGDAADWLLGKKNILSFSHELGNGEKNSEVFFPNRNITFDVLDKNLNSALYAIQKSMFFLKSDLIKAEYSPCSFKNTYNNIYFSNRQSLFGKNNLKDIEYNNCFSDEVIITAKIKMTNYGFGTYIPGIEFNYNQLNGINNENENPKKYFYFLALDLNVSLNNIRSICYWSNLLNDIKNETNNYTNNTNNKTYDIDKEKNETENEKDDLKVRCVTNRESEFNDMKLFIDKEIKFLESIIVNIQIIAKKESFIQKKNYLNKNKKNKNNIFENDYNMTNNNSYIYENETDDLIRLYTKKERIIKSENINGEIIEWKFNNPSITIKFEEFNETKINNKIIVIKQNPFKFLSYMIISTLIMIFFIFRIIKLMNFEPFQDMNMNQANNRRVFNGNNNNNIRQQNVINFENLNQFRNNSNEQLDRYDNDNEYFNSENQ